MKKIISIMLVFALVLGSFSFAFASDDAAKLTGDIENDDVVRAVKRLAAFGIVNGMEDGEYHPELDVTREQFAKLVVEALGLGKAAEAAQVTTEFSDVAPTRWSAGYVNIAAGQGIVNGMPDGTFRPAEKVTYAQAVTMLVRGLGYKDQYLPGNWPQNCIAKAAELDLTDDVEFAPSGNADRGSVAILVNNTLDAKIVKVRDYEGGTVNYIVSDETLLEDRLDSAKVENIRVVANSRLDDSLDSDELELVAIKDDVKIDDKEYDEGEDIKVEIGDMIDPELLIGAEITGYFDDDKLVYAQVETKESDIHRTIAYDDEGDGTIYVWEANDYFKFDENAVVYINGEKVDLDLNDDGEWYDDDDDESLAYTTYNEYTDSDYSYGFARKLVSNNDEITFMEVFVPEKVNMLVKDVDADDSKIEYVLSYNGDIDYEQAAGVDLDDDEELDLDDYDTVNIYRENGEKIELSDIEENDIIYFAENAEDDDIAEILVADAERIVSGEFDKVRVGVKSSGFTRSRLTVDDEDYYVASKFAYTEDEMDNVKGIHRYTDLDKELDDVFGEEVSLYRDLKGRVAFLSTDVEATTDNYGVVLGVDERFGDHSIKLWNTNDAKAVYEYDTDSDIDVDELEEGIIVKYDLNSNGDEIEILDAYDIKDAKELDDVDDDNVELKNGDRFYDDSESVYINYSDYLELNKDDDELEALTWDDVADSDVDGEPKVLVVADEDQKHDIALLVFVEDYEGVIGDDIYEGYIAEMERKDDSKEITVDIVGEKDNKTYIVEDDEDAYDELEAEMPIVFTEKGKDGIRLLSNSKMDREDYYKVGHVLNYKEKEGYAWVVDRDGRYLTIATYEDGVYTEKEYRVDRDALVYYDDGKEDLYELDFGYGIEYLAQGDEILAAKYWEDGDIEGTDVEFFEDEDAYDEFMDNQDVDKDVKNVNEKINDLPEADKVTLDDEDAIVAAREAYDALDSDQKDKVSASTLEKLTDAEAKLEELKGDDSGSEDVEVTAEFTKKIGDTVGTLTVSVENAPAEATQYKVYFAGQSEAIGPYDLGAESDTMVNKEVKIVLVDKDGNIVGDEDGYTPEYK